MIILGCIETFFTGFDGKSSDVWVDSHHQEKADKQAVIDQVSKGFVGCFLPENGEGATIGHGLFNVSNFRNARYEIFVLNHCFLDHPKVHVSFYPSCPEF